MHSQKGRLREALVRPQLASWAFAGEEARGRFSPGSEKASSSWHSSDRNARYPRGCEHLITASLNSFFATIILLVKPRDLFVSAHETSLVTSTAQT
jgi:hypothetical protein